MLILLDQVNDLSKSAKSIIEYYCIVYLVFVGVFKKNVTHQAWRALFQFGKCLKKMVSHTAHMSHCKTKLQKIFPLCGFFKNIEHSNNCTNTFKLLVCLKNHASETL